MQEFLGAGFKGLEEAQELLAQGRQIIGPGLQMEEFLLELAPEFLNRITKGKHRLVTARSG